MRSLSYVLCPSPHDQHVCKKRYKPQSQLEKQTTTDPPEQSDQPLVKAQIKIARPSDRIAVSYSNHNDNLLVKTNTKVCLLSSKNKKKKLGNRSSMEPVVQQ